MVEYTKLLPPGFEHTEAMDINDKGEVLLRAVTYKEGYHASHFLYVDGEYNELPACDKPAHLSAINNNGEAVGSYDRWPTDYSFRVALYRNGHYYVLYPPQWSDAGAFDINDIGVIVGSGFRHIYTVGFIYDKFQFSELLPPGCAQSEALRINNKGVVIGSANKNDGTTIAFIATPVT